MAAGKTKTSGDNGRGGGKHPCCDSWAKSSDVPHFKKRRKPREGKKTKRGREKDCLFWEDFTRSTPWHVRKRVRGGKKKKERGKLGEKEERLESNTDSSGRCHHCVTDQFFECRRETTVRERGGRRNLEGEGGTDSRRYYRIAISQAGR